MPIASRFLHAPAARFGSDSNLSACVSHRKSQNHKTMKTSSLTANNGICGKYISASICRIAAQFWHQNMDQLSAADRLEIGVSIFFGIQSSHPQMKKILKRNGNQTIEQLSAKFVFMVGWLMRMLVCDNIDLYALLTNVGKYHLNMGIDMDYFAAMLQAIHEAFSYYFDTKYTIEVKYAFDEIFALASKLMTGQPLNGNLMNIADELKFLQSNLDAKSIPFLQSLDLCLQSNVGQQYLYRYLRQTWCDEMVIFLQTLSRFKSLPSEKEKFMVAREIIKTSIETQATFSLNLSYSTRENALIAMQALEKKFAAKEAIVIPATLFDEVEAEVHSLISDNHWNIYKESIEGLLSQSVTSTAQ